MDEFVEGLAGDVGVVGLGKERDDSDAGVAADNGDRLVGGVGVLDLSEEAGGADDVEGGNTEEALGVVDALGFEDFGADGDGGVDLSGNVSQLKGDAGKKDGIGQRTMSYRVGNDEDVGVGCGISASFCEITDNRCVGVEKICQLSGYLSCMISMTYKIYHHESFLASGVHRQGSGRSQLPSMLP